MKTIKAADFDALYPPALPPVPDAVYDWNELLDENIHILEPGRDFTCSYKSMTVYLRRKAGERKLKIAVRKCPITEHLIYRAYKGGGPVPQLPENALDHRDAQEESEAMKVPTCSVCGDRLTGASANRGECFTVHSGYKHRTEEAVPTTEHGAA